MTRHRRNTGFTLIEVGIVTVITAIMLLAIISMTTSTNDAYTVVREDTDANFSLRQALNLISDDLRQSATSIIQITEGYEQDTLKYQLPISVKGSTVNWGSANQLGLYTQVLVEDGWLVRRVVDAGGIPQRSDEVLARNVDEMYMGEKVFNFKMQFVSGLFYMAASWVWGQLGDRWSARRGLLLCVLISITPPCYYLFATKTETLPILLAWIVGTIAWAGIFVYGFQCGIAMAPAKDRSVYLAFQSAVLGLVSAAAYLLASGLVKLTEGMAPLHVWGYDWTNLQLMFCLSAVGRALSLIPLVRMRTTSRS